MKGEPAKKPPDNKNLPPKPANSSVVIQVYGALGNSLCFSFLGS